VTDTFFWINFYREKERPALFRFEDPIEGEDNTFLLIGFDTKANPIEVKYNRIDADRNNVFHAMPFRPEYVKLINQRRPWR
jgi:hypothetical protein